MVDQHCHEMRVLDRLSVGNHQLTSVDVPEAQRKSQFLSPLYRNINFRFSDLGSGAAAAASASSSHLFHSGFVPTVSRWENTVPSSGIGQA